MRMRVVAFLAGLAAALGAASFAQINGGGPNGGGGGGGGSVTSVNTTVPAPLTGTGCSYTTTGTCAITWTAAQTANRVLATPSGTTGAVSLRALTLTDLPAGTATIVTGSFTMTIATGCTTTPTVTVNYTVIGGLIVLTTSGTTTCTSNSTAMTLTGFPGAVTPSATRIVLSPSVEDNGVIGLGSFVISSAGAGTVNNSVVSGTVVTFSNVGFTATGIKGFQNLALTYPP